jgi:hypothetical protein
MRYKKINWKFVGIALLPALALSMLVAIFGARFGASEAVVDRIAQVLFFPMFFGFYALLRARARNSRAV